MSEPGGSGSDAGTGPVRPAPRPRPAPRAPQPVVADEPVADEPVADEVVEVPPRPAPVVRPQPKAAAARAAADAAEPSVPAEPAAADELADADELAAADEPAADEAHPRPTRADRRRAEAAATRSGTVLTRVAQVAAVVFVLAGVALFVVVRHADHTSAAPRHPKASSAAADPQAYLTDSDAGQAFVGAAISEVVAVSESDYRRLDDALSAGLSVTTGDFRARYQAALTGAAAQARIADHEITSLIVDQAGVGEMSADGSTAKVLVFATISQSGDDIPSAQHSVASALCVTLVKHGNQYLISNLVDGANAGLPPGTAGLSAAAEAIRSETIATLTYHRSTFQADLATAEAGATGSLKQSIESQAAQVKANLVKGGYDQVGSVTSVAVQQATGDSVTLLVSAVGTATTDAGVSSVVVTEHYLSTAERIGGTWLVNSLIPVG